jgi:hypothetical protein
MRLMNKSINQSRNSQVSAPKRAQELAALIEEHGWHLVNIPDVPTSHYKTGTGSSVLDITLAAPAMANEIVNWAIDDEQGTGSDHEVIRFQVISQHPDLPTASREPRLNWKKTDWAKFTKTLRLIDWLYH